MEDMDSLFLDFFKEDDIDIEIDSESFKKFIDYSIKLLYITEIRYCLNCHSFFTRRNKEKTSQKHPSHQILSRSEIIGSLPKRKGDQTAYESMRIFYLNNQPIINGTIRLAKIKTKGTEDNMKKLYNTLKANGELPTLIKWNMKVMIF
jgi:hypothetical protein